METMKRVLLAEDDFNFGTILKKRLHEAGYDVTLVPDGEMAVKTFFKSVFDICILDIVMPKRDGYSVANAIRQKNDLVPIIFLTSKDTDEEKIRAFQRGVDCYLTKPCALQELLLRIDVFIRRSQAPGGGENNEFRIGKYQLNVSDLTLHNTHTGKLHCQCTQRETDLLKFFALNLNKTIKREEILYHVWGKDDYFLGRSMDVFITKIRKLFRNDPNINLETLHGIGFKFTVTL